MCLRKSDARSLRLGGGGFGKVDVQHLGEVQLENVRGSRRVETRGSLDFQIRSHGDGKAEFGKVDTQDWSKL